MSSDTTALIEIDRLTKSFGGFTAVNDVSFDVGRGEVVGFLGPNGAGKSTTMKMLAGFVTPSAGTAPYCRGAPSLKRAAGAATATSPFGVRTGRRRSAGCATSAGMSLTKP